MIKYNLLQPELIENFVPVVEQERRQQAERFLLCMACFLVVGIAIAWIVYAVKPPPAIPVWEEEKEQL
jgi:hypothetical protein